MSMHVLFVDDDAMNRRVVRDMLKVAGVTMEEAEDGIAGLDAVEQGDFDLILMDLRMPGMDGLTAIGHIRARADAKAGLPIIVVTADTSIDIQERCLSRGADGFMTKPVAMKQLFELIGKQLASKAKAS